jgi:hypothetical protein
MTRPRNALGKDGRFSMGTRRTLIVALALSNLAVGGTAAGDFVDGNKLLQHCNEPYGTYSGGFCDGYISGVGSAFNEMQGFYCFPGGVKAGQVIDLVKLYLTEHPEKRNYGASSLVIAALKEKFPCN